MRQRPEPLETRNLPSVVENMAHIESNEYRKVHCPAYGKTCSHCGKQNHLAHKCQGYGQRSRPSANVREFEIGMLRVHTSSTSSEKQAVVIRMLAPN